jgi:hypothetical protein
MLCLQDPDASLMVIVNVLELAQLVFEAVHFRIEPDHGHVNLT